jgi:hypothetical protein
MPVSNPSRFPVPTPQPTRSYISSYYLPYDFSFTEEERYAGLPLVTATSPDGMANLQLLGEQDDIQFRRILIYLPIDAEYDFANQQYTYFDLLLNSIFGDDASMVNGWSMLPIPSQSAAIPR